MAVCGSGASSVKSGKNLGNDHKMEMSEHASATPKSKLQSTQ